MEFKFKFEIPVLAVVTVCLFISVIKAQNGGNLQGEEMFRDKITTSTLPPEYQDIEAAERNVQNNLDQNAFGMDDGQTYNGNRNQLGFNGDLNRYGTSDGNRQPLDDSQIPVAKKYYGTYRDQDQGSSYSNSYNHQQPNYYQSSQSRYQQQPNYYSPQKSYNGARYTSLTQNSNPKAQTAYTYNSFGSQARDPQPQRYASLQGRPESSLNSQAKSNSRQSNTPQPKTSVQISYEAMRNTPSLSPSSNAKSYSRPPANTPQPVISIQESDTSQTGNGRNAERNRQKGKSRLRQGGRGRGRGNNRNRNNNPNTDQDNLFNYQSDAAASMSNSVLENEYKGDIYPDAKPVKTVTCKDLRCEGGGVCVPDTLLGGVRCQCPLGKEGELCQKDVVVRYPKFLGFGYMAFPVLRGAYREFTITIEFRPDTLNGLLLFSSENPTANTDFFSVAIIDGHVEFRFDCGTGIGVISSVNKFDLGEWNTVTVHRRDWEGSLQLNDNPKVYGRSRGLFSRITFRQDFYLGGYRNLSLVGSRTGIDWGFVGCVRSLSVNGKDYDMRKGPYIGDAIHGVDVGECSSHVCAGVQCMHGGQCMADSADTSVCLCRIGSAGDRCESKIDIYVPSFDGTSYLQFLGLRRSVLMFTEIEVVFKPLTEDGLVLYNGYRTDRTGDYLSLALVGGILEFRFDLGTGPAVLRSREPLSLDTWHSVKVTRTGRDGKMKIDNQHEVIGMAKGAYTQLTLTLDLFIGGHRNFDEIAKTANIHKSFKGCIQKVIINERPLKLLEESREGVNIENCEHPCVDQPCLHGGRCIAIRDLYKCSCPLGFEGTRCEESYKHISNAYAKEANQPITLPMFSGDSFLMYDDSMIMQKIKGIKNDIELRVKATGPNGLLLWAGEADMGASSDFLAVGMDNGHVILRFNLGSGEVLIPYNLTRIDDGNWHKIRVKRYQRIGSIEVDGGDRIEDSSPGGLQQLNVENKLYLGGMHVDKLAHNTLKKFTTGFEGCISNLTLAAKYHIDLMEDVEDGENIHECTLAQKK